MSRAVLSIGSNEGDSFAHLATAVTAFSPYLVGVSPVFSTPPWGGVVQADFLNAVLIVSDDQAEAADWLRRAQEAERAAGRTREVRWGPRTLDVDVITVDDVRSDDPHLTLPHPHAAERAFVLVPWWALDPEAELPGRGSVLSLMQALPQAELDAVRLLPATVLPKAGRPT
ncbi:2-amino-4-hydroxy-6-hydroxymethyldihydropteridine diphosphokinase [Jatrophihabitans telluris]|uniref:2-amino-4-hydroxy-6-hydroxymethyldihydropteridine diphosphokinase n=1 Tax=Jatrophihabitans telluris TaxID=2038343 RepID=A0ABY4R0Q2_9ACTN|nr:2-amino-4-hydroxy-6-hydroxymethyldihydropteridine diphosphokinase [Jatrophihabitans telluris]UQX88917.1 2-amino-4-hydroxy-6-hydroxymethyldihydropteridine diphosphokinase [Jatrophihabitans telluris]